MQGFDQLLHVTGRIHALPLGRGPATAGPHQHPHWPHAPENPTLRGFDTEFQGLQRYEPISRSHEGLVHVLQLGPTNPEGFFYYVMEVADDQSMGREINPDTYAARTLRSEIVNRGRIPVGECLRIALSLLEAIAHIHKHGLVHRDIKPDNVVFVVGMPKLADIGLVAQVGRMTYGGTPGFIPPEGPGKPSADIYSVGKLIYEAMTGLSARDDFPRLPPNPSKAMRRLSEVLLKTCADDVRKRYKSAHELHAALPRLR